MNRNKRQNKTKKLKKIDYKKKKTWNKFYRKKDLCDSKHKILFVLFEEVIVLCVKMFKWRHNERKNESRTHTH